MNIELKKLLEELNQQLTELKKIRFLPGNNIRITETDAGILLEVKNQELSPALQNWIVEADRKLLNGLTLQSGKGVIIEECNGSYRISTRDPDAIPRKAKPAIVSTPAEENDYPFKVTLLSSNMNQTTVQFNIRMLGYNETEKRFFRNYVYAGLAAPLEIPEQDFTITTSSWIYFKLTYSGNTPLPQIIASPTLALQTATQYIVPLAHVSIQEQNCKITQLHYGNIEVSGRII